MTSSCILCRIRDGEVAVELLHRDELVYAMDVPGHSEHFLGPVHFVVIPNKHIASALEMTDDEAATAGRMFSVAGELARRKGIAEGGFRLATNIGPDANQTVFHFHLHCFGGRKLGREG